MQQATDKTLRLQVTHVASLASTIKRFELRNAGGGALPEFAPGAHVRVEVTTSLGTIEERSYSLINSTDQGRHYEIAVHLEPAGSGGSAFMHRLVCGDTLRASAPRNDFQLAKQAARHVLIAGGIGITPILSMQRHLDRIGADYELHYAGRSEAHMAYREEIERRGGERVTIYCDGGDPARGVNLRAMLANPQPGTHVYVCGPRGMIDATIAIARAAGWAQEAIHFELFGTATARSGDREIDVELRRSGTRVVVRAGQSILDAVLDAGFDPLYDCKRGECGVCATTVLEGEPDHRDYILGEEDRQSGRMCICVSRARTPTLVLDL